ncbi:hypothetical protein ACFMKC_19950, partial [Acinetobacter baumannii]|uniref:hypothetical protein n=1 Tax=Acinetobacter baumannii TaxID=470 RepID=UPI0037CB2210
PEYWYLPVGGGYVPAYRLFTGKQLHIVPGNQPMATAGQAMAVAREYVRQRLNSPVQACTVEPEAELDEIERWRRKKADEAAAEKAKVFGS